MTAVLPKQLGREFAEIPFAHLAGTDADVSVKARKLPRDLRINRVQYFNATGLAEHAANYAAFVVQYPLVVADDDVESVSAANDTLTLSNHGLENLDGPVQLTNSGGALPAGLSAATDYWVIRVDANTIALAATLNAAIAGTKVNITGAGTGTHTIVDTASTRRVAAYKSTNSALPAVDDGIAAATWTDLTLNDDRALFVPRDTVIEFNGDEEGTTNIPAGSGFIEGHWVR